MFDEDPQLRFLARQWLNDGSALPLVRRLDCADRALEAALLETANTPDGWLSELEKFAKDPSQER
jgi:hypothetical protein